VPLLSRRRVVQWPPALRLAAADAAGDGSPGVIVISSRVTG
jgi:hypothetical protein